MSGHTPGPWVIRRDVLRSHPSPELFGHGSRFVAACGNDEAAEANALLIAAAPDLLAALKGLRGNCFCELGIGNPMVRSHSAACVAADAALAKAGGRE